MEHKLHTIYTGHYSYSGPDRVDITVKGQDPNWKEFAPTWDMVMGVKNGTMTEQQYLDLYRNTDDITNRPTILGRVSTATWNRLLSMETATFVCFCPEGAFCHRNALLNFILSIMGDRIKYGGWRSNTPRRGRSTDKVLPVLNNWAECGTAELEGVSESGEQVYGLFQADDLRNMRPGTRVGIIGCGFWVLGYPAPTS